MPHRKLEVWKVTMELVKSVYQITSAFPAEERYGLSQQMRRAAVSIPSNIAEGAARSSAKEYAHFIAIARGSLAELDTQLRIAEMLGFVQENSPTLELCKQAGRLLTGLYNKWRQFGIKS